MTRVVVATCEWSRRPEFGGHLWVPMQYLLGLRDLGVEARWVDHLGRVDPYGKDHTAGYLWARLRDSAASVGLEGACAIVYDGGAELFGCSDRGLARTVDEADGLLTIGRTPPTDSPVLDIPRRAYVDVDPGFTQIWDRQQDSGLDAYHHFFTVGQNVGSSAFGLPTDGRAWQPVLPPVHLPSWPPRIDERCRRYSTVADWRGSQDALLDGEYYGTKRSEFVRFLHVPQRAGRRIELALCIGQHDHEDLGLLTGHNWRVRNPYRHAGDPLAYREFIQHSRAEFGVAKHGYVKSNSGWFSDRTACYLASGKPAIVQSTGFEPRLPTGRGLLTFDSVDAAVAAVHEVEEKYRDHCRAARAFAERHLDAGIVLGTILRRMGVSVDHGGVGSGGRRAADLPW